jgi:hypothetical protein
MRLILLRLLPEGTDSTLALRRGLSQRMRFNIIRVVEIKSFDAEKRRFRLMELIEWRAKRRARVGGLAEGIFN